MAISLEQFTFESIHWLTMQRIGFFNVVVWFVQGVTGLCFLRYSLAPLG